MMKRSLLAFLFVSFALHAQNAYLVKDLNATRADGTSSYPTEFTSYKSRVYFSAYTTDAGYKVWSTDGTEAGTMSLSALAGGQTQRRFAVVNGNLTFNGSDSHGVELWVTDGTAAGTRLMADIDSGSASSNPGQRIVYHDKMLFDANDGVDGRELWITDGTPQGTRFLKDLRPGPDDSNPRAFVLFHDLVYFVAAGGLWKSDGTEAGTVLVTAASPLQLIVAGDRMYFAGYTEDTGTEPWVSDGTAAGTHMIADVVPGPVSSASSYLMMQPFGDRLLFSVSNTSPSIHPLWISDGTASGTHLLLNQESYPLHVATLNGIAMFSARTPENGYELWRTDGTEAGTFMVRDIAPGVQGSSPQGFITAGNQVFFAASQDDHASVWATDGTAAGTHPVSSEPLYMLYSNLTNIDGVIYFAAANALNGLEPWRTDGTEAGTRMIANIAGDAAPSSEPIAFVAAGDLLYFLAYDGTHDPNDNARDTLFRTDGTAEGTIELSEKRLAAQQPVGRSVFFEWENALWKSDGTPESTGPANEYVYRFPSKPSTPVLVGGKLFSTVRFDYSRDAELFVTDPAPGSPAIDLGVEASPHLLTDYAGRIVWIQEGRLYMTDGTAAGTTELLQLEDSRAFAKPVVFRGQLFFLDFSGGEYRLWRSDGTFEGTSRLKTFTSEISNLTAAGSNLFFVTNGQLGVSDGTEAGTRLLPGNPQSGFGSAPDLAVLGDRVVFIASDADHGPELWVSDGTDAGTHLLRDINPGSFGADIADLTPAGPVVYFTAFEPEHSYELWMTDGTAEGTKIAADVDPGTDSSIPRDLTVAGNRLFFSATTRATGRELWALPLPGTTMITIDDVRVSEGSANARFTVRLPAASSQTVSVDYATADVTALAGNDYDAKSGTLVFAPGETAKTIDVPIRGDASGENNESFRFLLRNSSGAVLARSEAAAIIEDDDQSADLALSLDLSFLYAGGVRVNVTNNGPRAATNVVVTGTVTPTYLYGFCTTCREVFQILPGATEVVPAPTHSFPVQQYYTMTARALQRDPQSSNNTIAWTAKGPVVMEAHQLTPGADAKVWFYDFKHAAAVNVESSNPAAVTVPASVPGQLGETAASFMIHAAGIGRSTIRLFNADGTIGTLDVDVLAPGTKVRWPGAITAYGSNVQTPFDRSRTVYIQTDATAPFTGRSATGVVTIVSSNGRELGRVTLKPDVHRYDVSVYATQMDTEAIEFRYEGDENFLPVTIPSILLSIPGQVSITATSEMMGSTASVRIRVNGSPGSTPSGTVRLSEALVIPAVELPLAEVRPGLAEAVFTLTNVTAGTHTLVIEYSGDAFYQPSTQNTRIVQGRQRTVRH